MMTDEEFEAALKLDDPTARYLTWRHGVSFYSKILTLVQRPDNDKPVWVTRLSTTAHSSLGYAVYVLKRMFIEEGIPPL